MENKKLMLEVDPADVRDILWSLEELTGSMKHLLEVSDSGVETSHRGTELETFGETLDAMAADADDLKNDLNHQLLDIYVSGKLVRDAVEEFLDSTDTLLTTLEDYEDEIQNDVDYEGIVSSAEPLFNLEDKAYDLQFALRHSMDKIREHFGIGETNGEEDEYWND